MSELKVMQVVPSGRDSRLWRAIASIAEAPPSAEESMRRPATAGFAENLIFEFDEAYTYFVEGFETLPSEEQMLALQAVDTHVSSMVGLKDAELWTEGARREAAEWQDVRALAERVLEAFDWPRL